MRSHDIVTKSSPCLTQSIYLILKTVSDVLWESHPGTRAQAGEQTLGTMLGGGMSELGLFPIINQSKRSYSPCMKHSSQYSA